MAGHSLTSTALAGRSQVLATRIGPKPVMATGMTLIGAGVIWATQVPVHGHFLGNLAGPMLVAGAGAAFAFIPISIAALAGVEEHQAGLASGLLNTSQQLGATLGVAIASSVATSHTNVLLHAGSTVPTALTGGFQSALGVLGAIALLALPAIFALIRDESSRPASRPPSAMPSPRSGDRRHTRAAEDRRDRRRDAGSVAVRCRARRGAGVGG